MRALLATTLLAALLPGCGGGAPPVTGCETERGIRPICGFENPEDLVLLPDGSFLVSQMGGMDGSVPGSLARFDPDAAGPEPLFAVDPDDVAAGVPAEGWGDAACPGPPTGFAPHGIDLSTRPDGALQLLAVNHGGREGIEFFEVTMSDPLRVEWRGCALPEGENVLNDVVGLPDGGFLTTRMLSQVDGLSGFADIIRANLGFATGAVLSWSPEQGFQELPGTAGPGPNGVTTSADGRYVFVTLYMGNEVRRVALDGSEPPASVEVSLPDNLTWASDGRLLVASHIGTLAEMMACNGLEPGTACGLAFQIVAIDPESLETEVVFENAGPPMGAGTVAVERDGELFIGSFAGDRLIRTRF